MIRPLGKLWCWLRGRHRWGRAYLGNPNHPDSFWWKDCRCGAVAQVKRRVKKETT